LPMIEPAQVQDLPGVDRLRAVALAALANSFACRAVAALAVLSGGSTPNTPGSQKSF
jgi:hypothetical protein